MVVGAVLQALARRCVSEAKLAPVIETNLPYPPERAITLRVLLRRLTPGRGLAAGARLPSDRRQWTAGALGAACAAGP